MKWRIREIEISNPLVLAPMAGVTNEAFRRICKQMHAGLVMAEMVSDKAIGFQNEKTIKMTRVSASEHPISMQIFGGDVDSLVKAARFVDKESMADIIDINMGCPVNKVAKKSGAGASLLQDTNRVYELVKAVVENVKKPVTVKIRTGWDLEHINCVENALAIERAGASAITVHGRTRSQFYTGKADWSQIKRVKEAVSIPVIGNGDIIDIASAEEMLSYTGCDAIAIARGALGNPFLFRELYEYFENGRRIDGPTPRELYDTIVLHHKLLLDLKGEHLAMLEMRSHTAWYLKGMPGSAKIKDFCNRQTDFEAILEVLRKYLGINDTTRVSEIKQN